MTDSYSAFLYKEDNTKTKQMNLSNVAGAVVLYNPDEQFFENIKTYLNQVNRLYIVDNSDRPKINVGHYVSQIPKIHYIDNRDNLGIAYALNVAVRAAIADGYSYLLTMDDDSKAPADMVKIMANFLAEYSQPQKVGIISVAHSKPSSGSSYKKVHFTMTSGNILSLEVYKNVGPFDDDLFIDHVDHEYNLRLNIRNYEIIEIANIRLNHNLGVDKVFTLFGKKFFYVSHNPERLYYLVRNGVYISKKYFLERPIFCIKLLYLNLVESLKSLILENNKKKRFLLIIKALADVSRNKMGRVEYKKNMQ